MEKTNEALEDLIKKVDEKTKKIANPQIGYFSLDIVMQKDGAPTIVDYNRNPWGLAIYSKLPDQNRKGNFGCFAHRLGRNIRYFIDRERAVYEHATVAVVVDPLMFVGLKVATHYRNSLRILNGALTGTGIKSRNVFVAPGRKPGDTETTFESLHWLQLRENARPTKRNPIEDATLIINYGGTEYDGNPTYFPKRGVKSINAPRIASNVVCAKSACHTAIEELSEEIGLERKTYTPEFVVAPAGVDDVKEAINGYTKQKRIAMVKYNQYGTGGSAIAVPNPDDLEKRIMETQKMVLKEGKLHTQMIAVGTKEKFILPFQTVLVEAGVEKKTVELQGSQYMFDVIPFVTITEAGVFEPMLTTYRIAPKSFKGNLYADGWNANETGMIFGVVNQGNIQLSEREMQEMRLAAKIAGLGLLRLARSVGDGI